MNFDNPISPNKHLLIGLIIGIVPMIYFLLTGFMTDWIKTSDPMAHAIHFYIILPCSILFFILFAVSGGLYSIDSYAKPIKIVILIAVLISILISLCMFFSATISFIEIPKYTFVLFVIISPFLLLTAILIGKNRQKEVGISQ